MKVTLAIESLKCTEGSSNKGYQLVKVSIDGKLLRLVRVFGTLNYPNQMQTIGDGLAPLGIEDEHFKLLKSKLKKYNRHNPADDFEWHGPENEWALEGQTFIAKNIMNHGPWQNDFSNLLVTKIDDLVAEIKSLMTLHADTEAEDLFRTTKQREQAAQEKAEAQSLENWGAF